MGFFKKKPDSEIKNLADQLRPMVNPENYLLDRPSTNYKALDASKEENIIDVVNWGIFNPFGPTSFSLVLVKSVLTNEYFIFWYSNNPHSYMRLIYGLVPSAIVNRPQDFSRSLITLFKRYGEEIIGNHPTYIIIADKSPLRQDDIKRMFIEAMKTLNPPNLDKTCQLYNIFKGKPWDRAKTEIQDVVERMTSKQEVAATPLTSALLEKWWEIVSDPYHATIELFNIRGAWDGSLSFLGESGINNLRQPTESLINAEGYFSRGNTYAELEAYHQAIKEYDKAIELQPDYAEVYLSRGEVYVGLEDYERAVQDYSRTIELNPGFIDAYFSRGILYNIIQEYRGAIRDFSKVIELNPTLDEAYNNRGNAYALLDEEDLAIQDYNKAIGLNPDYADAYFNRANAKYNQEKYEQAIQDYFKALEINPKMDKAYYYRGLAYKQLEEYEKSRKDYLQAVELNPELGNLENY